MDLKVRVVTHAVPNTLGITLPAIVVLPVKQSVLVLNGFIQTHTSITMRTVHITNLLFFQRFAPLEIHIDISRRPGELLTSPCSRDL